MIPCNVKDVISYFRNYINLVKSYSYKYKTFCSFNLIFKSFTSKIVTFSLEENTDYWWELSNP